MTIFSCANGTLSRHAPMLVASLRAITSSVSGTVEPACIADCLAGSAGTGGRDIGLARAAGAQAAELLQGLLDAPREGLAVVEEP